MFFLQNSRYFDFIIQKYFLNIKILYKKFFTNEKECDIIEATKENDTEVKEMSKKKVVVLESNAETTQALKEALLEAGFDVCGETDDGGEGLKLIERCKPEVAVVGLVLKEVDGFGVLEYIARTKIPCAVIVTGGYTDDEIIARVLSSGAKYYMMKPLSVPVVVERVKEIANAEKSISGGAKEKRGILSLDEKISNIFISIGIPPHIKGYAYLREGIKMAVDKPDIINNVTKELYPNIAARFGTTPSKVERAIRHGIEVAWNRQRIDAINAVFGVRVYIGSEKPTNSEFIALVADKLILEGIANYR